jgi:hypothetical protein
MQKKKESEGGFDTIGQQQFKRKTRKNSMRQVVNMRNFEAFTLLQLHNGQG